MNLADFLLDRAQEDMTHAANFRAWLAETGNTIVWGGTSLVDRMEIEILAKGRVAQRLKAFDGAEMTLDRLDIRGRLAGFNATMFAARCLALAYADHEDYDEQWRL
ncbi:DUF6221 family protein [Jatrophihabitans sp. DSM 45814]